ncbi:GMP/IMP nucleotidase [Aestuariirhabdus litorea]|uniref:GMP/IMP nucleotidase n=1 Tax=Aestuariirhabdus litorea TaxID=2528527 RepID=A0A3P3VIG0_9GAMM|nr:GMP/IMP nucleotidase [Aestuariirhabdus litorea]RRJ82452.1 GMP/IMP nucleotidase [Aestuariirhabdus litorea]RWW92614.1 GMP/IMP nucleotidase [Endozoicomonadaceae bacterium GTF-13]
MIDWKTIDTVLLDMDGTLLDLHFDNRFWLEHVPTHYARQYDMSLEQAKTELYRRFEDRQGQLEWYCLDYWQAELKLDLLTMKRELAHLISLRPGAEAFLAALQRSSKRVVMITNAHQQSLSLKLEKASLGQYFDLMISSHQYGFAKEHPQFWPALQADIGIDPKRCLFIDDSLPVLRSGQRWGIAELIAISHPDSQGSAKNTEEFAAVNDFTELLPIE